MDALAAGTWLLLGAVAIASVWHPFRAGARSAAATAGLRLGIAFVSFIGLFVVPQLFDRGTGGLSVDTCPYVINKHSDAWWVSIVIVGLIWWSGVGVLKAAGVSFRRRERRVVGVVSASLVAIALALLADFVLAFSNVCP